MKFFRQENIGKFYRQGDVGLQKVDSLPDGVSEVFPGERIVLAYGEATGHAHAIERPAGKARLWDAGAERFLQVIAPVALSHEEHAPIALEVGIYKIVQQREYIPVETRRDTPVETRRDTPGETRRVRD